MDFVDSMNWVFRSQYFYRLAVFRVDKSRSKVVTDKLEMFYSVLLLGFIAAEVAFIGHKVYFETQENFLQTKTGEEIFISM